MDYFELRNVDFIAEDWLGSVVVVYFDFALSVGQALGIGGVAGVGFGRDVKVKI